MKSKTTYYTDDWKEKLVDDFYTEYYPKPRLEQSIFKYLDNLYYISEDEIFGTIYRKSDDYFMGKTQITDDLQNLFGLTLPNLLKIGPGEDDYIEPARNPIPRRVLNNWMKSKRNTERLQKESIVKDSIVCDNCGWNWKIKDGGDDLYICHKCNHNNTPLTEHKESKINPQLMIGDEITVVDVDESFGTMYTPERYKDYVVIGRRHRQPENWEGPDADTSYYVIEPLSGYSDKETLGRMLAGGGRKREEQLHPTDKWMLRKGFLRGEHLSEHTETKKLNPELMRGDEILVVSHGYERDFNKGPELYRPYQVVSIKQSNDTQETYYGLYPLEETDDNLLASILAGGGIPTEIILYQVDNWILRPGFRRGEHLSEQKSLKNNLINVELEEGDKILVVSRKETPAGYREPFPEHEPELFTTYVVIEKKYSGHKAKHPYHYFLLPEEQYDIFINDPYDKEVDNHERSLFPWIHDWILDNEDIMTEHKESKINPELEVDDIIRIIDVDGEHDRKPEKFKLYRVAYKGNKPIGHGYSWETEPRIWYDIVPTDLDYDTVRTFDSRGTPMYHSKSLYPGDTWIKMDEVISEQSADSPGDNISDDDEEYVDNTPFTKKEILILNQLHKKLTKDELHSLVIDTPGRGSSDYHQHQTKFWEVMKLFGMDYKNDAPYQTRISQYAKWAFDNWTPEGDYGKIENPVKVPLKWYNVSREETGTQIEYKSGEAEVLGFDYDNAEERANNEFWEWGGEMEPFDYGDYEAHDSEITGIDFVRLDEAKRIVKVLNEQDESGLERQIIQAETEDFQELMYEVLRRVRQIPLDKTVSPRRIKEILSDDGVSFDLYQGADLNEEIHREYNRVRFYEYSQQLLKAAHSKGVRGHYFEGLLAGLFNGEVVSPMEGEMTDPKEDVLINGINYSAKLVRAQDKKWGTSSLLGGFKKAIIQRLVDRDIEVPDELLKRKLEVKTLNELVVLFPEGDPDRESFQVRHMELFLKDSSVDRKYKEITMNYAFTSKSEEEIGIELHWIFGLIWGTNETFEGEELPTTNLKYYLMDTPSLIDGILDGDIHFTKGRNIREIRISEKSMIDSNGASEHSIIFPVITRQDLKNLLYDEKSEEMVYKVMGIFKDFRPGTEKYMHHKIADVIADNPQEFIKRLQDLFPEKKITKETFSRIIENIDTTEIKYAIDQQYRTEPDLKSDIIQSILGDEETTEDTFYLNPQGVELNVPPIKIAQKVSDINDYGEINFEMQGGNGIAYFTDKDLVIKLTTDESEYHTATKLLGTENKHIANVLESAKINTSHIKGDLFMIVTEALHMTKEMEEIWHKCCCSETDPIYIDYTQEPARPISPVSEHAICQPIYDNIISIISDLTSHGITWSDIGIDNLGIKNGKLALIDLGDSQGGSLKGKILTLERRNDLIQRELLYEDVFPN